ncbi:MAG: ABC transporter ATP-binding protein [Saprospiraceae bacterium]|nr:ABC transporter ATP-binding protein [Saprospiraceae bacterium]
MSFISIKNVSKKFGKQTVLDNISLDFKDGNSIALIGPNGSGKTTLIKAILGLVLPDSGQILVKRQNISESPQYRKIIGYMPQLSLFPQNMKVQELFVLIENIRKEMPTNGYDVSLYQDFEIAKMRNKALGTLSGGMKQQVSAALAFYFRPEIIILDEPTAGLDPLSNEILKRKINTAQQGEGLVLTTSHILSDLDDICSHVIYLMEGQVLFNKSIDEMRSQTKENRLNKMVAQLLNSKQHEQN